MSNDATNSTRFWELLEMDLGWFGLGRVPTPAEKIIERSGLPADHRALIFRVVKRTKLWRSERADVARELVAHFTDGLESGAAAPELLCAFGNEKQAAKLIRRAKKRQRGYVWKSWVLAWRAAACLFGAIVIAYLVLGVQAWTAHPTIRVDYSAELNRPALEAPDGETGWPLYYAAIVKRVEAPLVRDERDKEVPVDVFMLGPEIMPPGGTYWPEMRRHLEANAEALELVRAAASKELVGFVPGRDGAALKTALGTPDMTDQYRSLIEALPLVYIPRDDLGVIRRFAQLLWMDMRWAGAEARGERILSNLEACLGIAHQMLDDQIPIAGLVAGAIAAGTFRQVSAILENEPDALTATEWRDAAHRVASWREGRSLNVALTGERLGFLDFLQRTFTDDGHSSGVMTLDGLRLIDAMQLDPLDWSRPRTVIVPAAAAAPLARVVIADRKSQWELFDRLITRAETINATPLWLRGPQDEFEDDLDSLIRPESARYDPVSMFLPSFDTIIRAGEGLTQQRDAILAAIALEIFHRREGRYPDSLDELVPDLLPGVPPDRHTGRPLNYRLKDGKPIIYSVGIDLIDGGGAPLALPSQVFRNLRIADGRRRRVSDWLHPDELARVIKENPGAIPDGDWILYPPSMAKP